MTKVLVAASSGIINPQWIEKCLAESLKSANIEISLFSEHHMLARELNRMGYASDPLVRGSAAIRRSDIRKALAKTDHLLVLWDGRTLNELIFEARIRSTPTKIFAIEVTQVVNKDRGDEFDAYIGRGTPWGNPFPVGKLEGQYERDESISLYKQHFTKNILQDTSLRKGLLGLRGLRIACHCKPLACHGDVIAEYLNSLNPDEES
jgi:hypothetical protein